MIILYIILFVVSWWVVGLIGAILVNLLMWVSWNIDVTVSREDCRMAWCGPFMLAMIPIFALIEMISYLSVVWGRYRVKLPSLPSEIILLKARKPKV